MELIALCYVAHKMHMVHVGAKSFKKGITM